MQGGQIDIDIEAQTRLGTLQLQLYKAALSGDWDTAQELFDRNEIAYNTTITTRQETALHIAVTAENIHFVEQLVEKLSQDDLGRENSTGNTAFCLAAITGNVEIAEVMRVGWSFGFRIHDIRNLLPIHMAALQGHKEMVSYLYGVYRQHIEAEDKKELFVILIQSNLYGEQYIQSNLYDTALEMVTEDPELVTARNKDQETALHAFAKKSSMTLNISDQKTTGIWNGCIKLFSAFKAAEEKRRTRETALELLRLIIEELVKHDDEEISDLIGQPWGLIFKAAEKGNCDFLNTFARSYPDVLFKVDGNRYSIFHIAVLHRHEMIYKLIHEIGSGKSMIATYSDGEENNILHLAAKLPLTQSRLGVVPGAALQMQRELFWFEEVKKLFQPWQLEAKNNERAQQLNPRELLLKEHKELMEQGEKWMSGTADKCMLAATLIATVVFAAAFTVPGGNGDTGIPIFLRKTALKIFAISDSVSLICSLSSVLTFSSIMTSRYAMEDFYWSLPNKLIIGLATLLMSMVAMLVAFSAALFLMFNHGHGLIWFVIPIAIASSVPVFLFVITHWRLLRDVLNSTYWSRSLFQANRNPLFPKKLNQATKIKLN